MKEVKFRAWDKKDNEMLYIPVQSGRNATWLQLDATGWSLGKGDGKGLVLQKDYELMQFTGLKDKNGKEIYEGDIVRWNSWGESKKNYPYSISQVIWHKEGEWRYTGSLFTAGIFSNVEVIGNIYENPELLK